MPADWRSLRPKGLPQSSRRRDKDTVTWFVDGEDVGGEAVHLV